MLKSSFILRNFGNCAMGCFKRYNGRYVIIRVCLRKNPLRAY